MSEGVTALEVMRYLDKLFRGLDALLDVHGVQKVETAGDCYIVAGGIMAYDDTGCGQVLQKHDAATTAERVLSFARDMREHAERVPMPGGRGNTRVRIGMHTGPCVSGIIGTRVPKFGVFGDTMNMASRMESTAPAGEIQVSRRTYELLKGKHEFEGTGGVSVKGKGVQETYMYRGEKRGGWWGGGSGSREGGSWRRTNRMVEVSGEEQERRRYRSVDVVGEDMERIKYR